MKRGMKATAMRNMRSRVRTPGATEPLTWATWPRGKTRGITMARKSQSTSRYDTVAARNPFTRGESTCCDIRSRLQWPKWMRVTVGKTTTLTSHSPKPRAARNAGAFVTRRCTSGGAGGCVPQRK